MKQIMIIHIVFFVLSLFQVVICSDCSSLYDKKLDELETKAIESRSRANKLWKQLNLSEQVNQERDETRAWYAEMEAILAEELFRLEEEKLEFNRSNSV